MTRLAAALLVGTTVFAADEIPTFRADVNLVRVDAQVTDASGRDIPSLQKNDFAVYDEGMSREIAHFGRESETLDLVLVLDVSGSMWQYLRALSTTTASALRQLRPGDRVALMLFASRAEIVQPFTTDFRQVEQRIVESIFKQTLGRDTLINDAVVAAADYARLNAPREHRRSILIITDNEGGGGKETNQDAESALSAANTALNAIVVGPGAEQERSRYVNPAAVAARSDVYEFARQSGGTAVTTTRVPQALAGTLAQIRTRYSLQYAAAAGKAGDYRHIRVELTPEARRTHPGAVVKAREGYYVTQ